MILLAILSMQWVIFLIDGDPALGHEETSWL
jgi:hypothetical protein